MTSTTSGAVRAPDARQQVRAMWAAGDYGAVARREFWQTGERLVRRLGVSHEDTVLDVACGTGNAALRAAAAGARVVGVDLTPELLEVGRALADEAGVEITWLEGNAEALPADDASFDVVVSAFGCMLAPHHALAAREIGRVLRPGGRMALCAWTPEGAMGPLFALLAQYLPQPSPAALPPLLWGTEDHVRELFRGTGVALSFERGSVPSSYDFPSPDAGVEYYTTTFGPLVVARQLAERRGDWPALRDALRSQLERQARERPDAEYLVALGRRAAATP